MDSQSYLQAFPEQKEKVIYLLDKVRIAQKTYNNILIDFLTPEEQIILEKICKDKDIHAAFFGGRGSFERAAAIIGADEYNGEFPVDIIKISGNFKFGKLTHRDYLGSILSLGIKREKVGDINVYEDGAEVYLSRDISDYVINNLVKIKHSGIKVKKIEFNEAREKILEFKDKRVNIASLRIDSVVAAAYGISRNDAVELIKSGSVKLNFIETDEPSKKVKIEDIFSVKGYGRFEIVDNPGLTKKDRLNVTLRKYI